MNPLFIIFGAITVISVFGMVTGLVSQWIKSRNEASLANDEAFLEALREFKEKTDRRLGRLEKENRSLSDALSRLESTSAKTAGAASTSTSEPPPAAPRTRPEPLSGSETAKSTTNGGQETGLEGETAGSARLRNMLR